jgi:hypothetical protein
MLDIIPITLIRIVKRFGTDHFNNNYLRRGGGVCDKVSRELF